MEVTSTLQGQFGEVGSSIAQPVPVRAMLLIIDLIRSDFSAGERAEG